MQVRKGSILSLLYRKNFPKLKTIFHRPEKNLLFCVVSSGCNQISLDRFFARVFFKLESFESNLSFCGTLS